MIHYDFKGRLQYIPGGALNVNMSAWPTATSANWWEPTTGSYTCVAAYQAKGAASLAASYVNLANPGTYDLTAGSAPTWDTSNGWSGATAYLRTGITISVGSSYTYLARYSNATTSSGNLFGIYGGATNKRVQIDVGDTSSPTKIDYGNGTLLGITGLFTSGDAVAGIAGMTAYFNGSPVGSLGAGAAHSAECYLMCLNFNGSPAYHLATGYLKAFVMYSTELDSTQMAEITTNMQAL